MPNLNFEEIVEKTREGLRKVQRSDEKTKKFYLTVFSSLAMIVVVGLWFFYLDITLPQPVGGAAETIPENMSVIEEKSGDSFFNTIARGAKNIFGDLKSQFEKIGESFSQVKEFTLEGGGAEFIPEEPLKPTSLP